ncbi:MAG: radical SAM protein [Planctomycetota bacterium]|nr:radical SAM protein [Planctomycetota bacterium]
MKVTAVLSMLHEASDNAEGGKCRNSATRIFRGEPVLAWTLYRLAASRRITHTAVACWEDQLGSVEPIAGELKAYCSVRSPRVALPRMQAISAARRWADGWRGGLLSTCEFDRGFHAGWISEIQQNFDSDAVLLIDPAAGLVDPTLLDAMIEHAEQNDEIDFFFSPAAPGLSGVLIRNSLLAQLSTSDTHPGAMLAYRPDLPQRDPISTPACVPIPASIARTTQRFSLDSERQIDRISTGTVHLNGQLISTQAEQLLHSLSDATVTARMPREVVIELNVERMSAPIYWPGKYLKLERAELPLDTAKALLDEIAEVDDLRLVFSGVGDPLLYRQLFDLIDHAHQAGIEAIALETDLLAGDETIDRLADSPVGVISVYMPALSAEVYRAVMGADGWASAMENLRRLLQRRLNSRRGTPLIVPTFVKLNENLAEMEPWYDHWLRTLGCAVVTGPTGYAGQMPDVSVANMEPPLRRPCARLAKRLTVLSDGRFVACEQDIQGLMPLGTAGRNSVADIWSSAAANLRRDHQVGNWQRHSLCSRCRDWHRP